MNLTASGVFHGTGKRNEDAQNTKIFYARLDRCGPLGTIAAHLMRVQKASYFAKRYRGGTTNGTRYADLSYKRKNDSIDRMCAALAQYANMPYGWGRDENQPICRWVLYIELPQGQVSFHAQERGKGPHYLEKWDGAHRSLERITAFADSVIEHDEQSMSLFHALGEAGKGTENSKENW